MGCVCAWVDGRRVDPPEESATWILSLTENGAMFFVGLRTAITRFCLCCRVKPIDGKNVV